MKKETKGFVAGLTVLAVSTGLGGAIGHQSYEITSDPEAQIDDKQSELEDIQEQQLVLDHDRDVIVADLGESCIRLVREYMPDGDLAGTDESLIVDDLLRAPNLPCGEVATTIRADVRNLLSAETAIAENELLSDELNDSIDQPPEDDLVGHIALITLGAGVGFVIGLGLGVKTEEAVLNIKGSKVEQHDK